MLIHPTLRMQSWGFAIGAALFARDLAEGKTAPVPQGVAR